MTATGRAGGRGRTEPDLVAELVHCTEAGEQVTLLLGTGVSAPTATVLSQVLDLADQYALSAGGNGDLAAALERTRDELGPGAEPVARYLAYRQVFTDWISGAGFDVVAQQAVLDAFQPVDWSASPLATHGIFQRLDLQLGERTENQLDAWALPPGVEALGRLLAHRPEDFGNRALTTSVGPLLEVAIRRAAGRAVSVTADELGRPLPSSGGDGAVRVFHLHGFWRPVPVQPGLGLLVEPQPLQQPVPEAVAGIAELVGGDRLCVLGYSGWDALVTGAILAAGRDRHVKVMWGLHGTDPAEAEAVRCRLQPPHGPAEVTCYLGVDSNRALTELAERLGVPADTRAAGDRCAVRHVAWERELISQPHNDPPDDVDQLLRQLERRFGWGLERVTGAGPPQVLFWPIRLRERASLIHAVQALAAGAMARRNLRVVVCLDDFGNRRSRQFRESFRADLLRWVRLVAPDAQLEFSYLQDFIDAKASNPSGDGPSALLRAADPWSVATAFFSEHNPSLYSVLAAIKIVPNVPLRELDQHAPRIVKALLSKDSYRLLTPVTLWAFLQDLIREVPASAVMTLGGHDEVLLWKLWRETFQLGVDQLHNPHIKGLNNESGMVRWASVDHLRTHLQRERRTPDWDGQHRYIPWLFQHGMLLRHYLTRRELPECGGFRMDSWAAFRTALDRGAPAIDLLAEQVSELYLGPDR